MTALGSILVVYGLFVVYVALAKPGPIWNMKKIQGFVTVFKETGTVVFFMIWGLAALAGGIVILL